MKKIAFVAAAAMLAASAFAQSSVTSSSGASVNSSAGVTVTPGVPTASVTVTPSTSVAVASHPLLPGGAMVQSSSTTILGGPSGDVAGTKTEVNTYWANVPADAQRDGNFQRWQRLR
jgi:cobalamin synthase